MTTRRREVWGVAIVSYLLLGTTICQSSHGWNGTLIFDRTSFDNYCYPSLVFTRNTLHNSVGLQMKVLLENMKSSWKNDQCQSFYNACIRNGRHGCIQPRSDCTPCSLEEDGYFSCIVHNRHSCLNNFVYLAVEFESDAALEVSVLWGTTDQSERLGPGTWRKIFQLSGPTEDLPSPLSVSIVPLNVGGTFSVSEVSVLSAEYPPCTGC